MKLFSRHAVGLVLVCLVVFGDAAIKRINKELAVFNEWSEQNAKLAQSSERQAFGVATGVRHKDVTDVVKKDRSAVVVSSSSRSGCGLRALNRATLKNVFDFLSGPPDLMVTAEPVEDDKFHWRGCLQGPPNTPYDGGSFQFEVKFPPDYPFKPFQFKWKTQMYHPNFTSSGTLCCCWSFDWSPRMNFPSFIEAVAGLFKNPRPQDGTIKTRGQDGAMTGPQMQICLVCLDKGKLYKEYKEKYFKNAREWTTKYAMGD